MNNYKANFLSEVNDIQTLLDKYVDNDSKRIESKKLYSTQIVLYNSSNHGKTSSLYMLLLMLTQKESFAQKIFQLFLNNVNYHEKRGKYIIKDIRIAFPYNGYRIYLSTKGDGRFFCENNMYFGRDLLYDKRDSIESYYVIEDQIYMGCDKVPDWKDWKEDNIRRIFISPCHNSDDTVDATMYYSQMLVSNIDRILWIRKLDCDRLKNSCIFTTEDVRVAEEMKNAIDRIIINGSYL